jgi:thymidylate synthase
MLTVFADDVNDAFVKGVELIKSCGIIEKSRNGDVLRAPAPVTTVYANPQNRVLFDTERNANPFFHLVESLWMIAGRNDLKALTPYVKRMSQYSDDGGKTQPAAYGYRWRNWFGHTEGNTDGLDQISWVLKRLRANPYDRRLVMTMWDGHLDPKAADANSKDVPCNLSLLPWVSNGKSGKQLALNITVFCRSNDMIMGAYGANAVHMSFLQEYLACQLCMEVGTYTQISNNAHIYVDDSGVDLNAWDSSDSNKLLYQSGLVKSLSLDCGTNGIPPDNIVLQDLTLLFEHGILDSHPQFRWEWLQKIATPMMLSHMAYAKKSDPYRFKRAYEILEQMPFNNDWRQAAVGWLVAREIKANNAIFGV